MNKHCHRLRVRAVVLWTLLLLVPGWTTSGAAVRLGADLLIERHLGELQGHRIGIVTNQTGRLSSGTALVDTLIGSGVDVVALFGPEHGIRGEGSAGQKIGDARDQRTGLPAYSLYGTTRKPTPEMLRSIDLLLYDIQDVGARFYTYISTMGLVMDAAAENGIPIIVLDRPNPLGGHLIDGPILDDSLRSFVGMYPIPVVYGMTCGELARMINGEIWLASGRRAQLKVIAMEGWTRDMTWELTGLPWVRPSPNIPDPATALIYPATCFIEATNLSEGRGTPTPFQHFGAPFVSSVRLTQLLNDLGIPGVTFAPAVFTPKSSKNANRTCYGSRISVTHRDQLRPARIGLWILRLLMENWRDEVKVNAASLKRLLGSVSTVSMLTEGVSIEKITMSWEQDLERFRQRSQEYYLYP